MGLFFFFWRIGVTKKQVCYWKKNLRIGTSPAIGLLPNGGCLLFLHAAGFVIAALTGASHLLYVKRPLDGFKFNFFVCSVPFLWKQMIISSFKVYSFLKALPLAIVGDFYILKNSAQLNETGYSDRKTAGQKHVEWYRCSKFIALNYTCEVFSYTGLLTCFTTVLIQWNSDFCQVCIRFAL